MRPSRFQQRLVGIVAICSIVWINWLARTDPWIKWEVGAGSGMVAWFFFWTIWLRSRPHQLGTTLMMAGTLVFFISLPMLAAWQMTTGWPALTGAGITITMGWIVSWVWCFHKRKSKKGAVALMITSVGMAIFICMTIPFAMHTLPEVTWPEAITTMALWLYLGLIVIGVPLLLALAVVVLPIRLWRMSKRGQGNTYHGFSQGMEGS